MTHYREKRPSRRVHLLLELELVVSGDIPDRRLGPQLVSMATADFFRIVYDVPRAELDGQVIDVDRAPPASPWRQFRPIPDRRVVSLAHELEELARRLGAAVAVNE